MNRDAIRGAARTVKVSPEQAAEERRLLGMGLTLKEAATLVGTGAKRLEERNRLIYKIDVRAAFAARMERDGLPSQLLVDDSFGHWFAGLFDGEGHFVMRLRRRSLGRGSTRCELELGLNVYLRDDDVQVLRHVHSAIGGVVRVNPRNNVAQWRLRGLKLLAELVVPLFTTYPLHSKKAAEFGLFRRLVVQRYVATLGGRRKATSLGNVSEIETALGEIRAKRRYAERTSWAIRESRVALRGVSFRAA